MLTLAWRLEFWYRVRIMIRVEVKVKVRVRGVEHTERS